MTLIPRFIGGRATLSEKTICPPSPEQEQFASQDLRWADFSNRLAQKANFRGANLDGARFDGADVRNSNFEDAQLCNATAKKTLFSGCVLKNANLQGAVLDGADFSQGDLSSADLRYTCLTDIRLHGAVVSEADFRFSRGLSIAEKKTLRERGARVMIGGNRIRTTVLSAAGTLGRKALCVILGLTVGSSLYLFFSLPHFQSIPVLREKVIAARQQQRYKRAIRLELALGRKFKIRENPGAMVIWALRTASLYKVINQRPKAFKLMNELLKQARRNDLVSMIKLEMAFFFKEENRWDKVRDLLREVEPEALKNDYDASMKLGRMYLEMKDYSGAESIFRQLMVKFGHIPGCRSEIAEALDQLAQEKKSQAKSGQDRYPESLSENQNTRRPVVW